MKVDGQVIMMMKIVMAEFGGSAGVGGVGGMMSDDDDVGWIVNYAGVAMDGDDEAHLINN